MLLYHQIVVLQYGDCDMRWNLYLSIAAAVFFCLSISACSEDASGPAYLEIEEGAHFPCLGVKRIKVTVTDGQSENTFETFGDYYDQEGRCMHPIYAHATFDGLNTGTMMIRVEGFDSSEQRRISLGSLGPVGKKDVDSGYLGACTIDREPVNESGVDRYPFGTVVVEPLPQTDEVENVESLEFILNAGTANSINGGFLLDPEAPLEGTELTISSVPPFEPPGSLVIVARYKNVSVAQWSNLNVFSLEEDDMFVDVAMAKEP
jgi:hypothetical protein